MKKLPDLNSSPVFKNTGLSILILLLSLSVMAQSYVEKHGPLSVKGRNMLDKNGNPIQLKGMSLFWSSYGNGKPYFNENTVKNLWNDYNVTVIRAPLGIAPPGGTGYENDPSQANMIKAVIDAAIKYGIYVIVDFHAHDAAAYKAKAKTFFTDIAKTYGSKPNIIYEIWNEPTTETWVQMKSYHDELVQTIRVHDTSNIIVCGTGLWDQKVDEPAGNWVTGTNIMYALHFYAATPDHMIGSNWLGVKAKSAWDKNVPLFVTEYGTCEATGGGAFNQQATRDWWTWLDERKISYVNWGVHDKSETAAALKPGTTSSGPWPTSVLTPSGNFVLAHIKNSFKDSTPVCTNKPVTSVSLNQNSTTIAVCKTGQITAIITPADACNKAVTWMSDNTSVATVSASGLVTAVSGGTANITVKTTDGGFTAKCVVTVNDPQTAYGNNIRMIPGRIEAEDYDTGGECSAYHDSDPGNNGGQYRQEDVDIKSTSDNQGGGYDVGWGANSEWLEYTVNTTAGIYDMKLRIGSANSGSKITVKLDSVTLGTVDVPNMGNWNDRSTVTVPLVTVTGGKKILRLEISGSGGADINWIEFSGQTTGINDGIKSSLFRVMQNFYEKSVILSFDGGPAEKSVRIIDHLGRVVMEEKIWGNILKREISVRHLPAGVYIVQASWDAMSRSRKIIIH